MRRNTIEAWWQCAGCAAQLDDDVVPKVCPHCACYDIRLNISINLPGVTARDIIGVIADYYRYKEEFSDGG